MHLHGERLERFQKRDLPQPLLSTIDGHVSNCLYCSRSLAQIAASSEQWERRGWLGRLVRIEEPQTAAIVPPEEEPAAQAA